jgi:hypothetical protein
MDYGIRTDTELDKSRELHDYLGQIVKKEAGPGLFREVEGKLRDLNTEWSEDKILDTMRDDLERILAYTVKPHSLGAIFSPMNEKDYSLIRDGLITIGAEANGGKSSLLTALALDLMERDQEKAFLFYTLDDSIFLSGKRILSQLSEKNQFHERTSPEKFEGKKVLSRIILREALSITVHSNQILDEARRVKKLTRCSQIIVGVDYLQILPNGTDVLQREFYNMAVKSIKEAQKTLEAEGGCILFLLSQLNRDTNSGTFRYRETSEIENQSDVCLDLQQPEKEDSARLITVSKNKLGLKGRTWKTRIGGDFNFSPLLIAPPEKKGNGPSKKDLDESVENICKNAARKKETKAKTSAAWGGNDE